MFIYLFSFILAIDLLTLQFSWTTDSTPRETTTMYSTPLISVLKVKSVSVPPSLLWLMKSDFLVWTKTVGAILHKVGDETRPTLMMHVSSPDYTWLVTQWV